MIEKDKKNIADDLLVTLKAVAKKDNIKLEFSDAGDDFFSLNQSIISNQKVVIPKVNSIKKGRANIDLAACYLLFHDEKIFAQTSQIDNLAEQKLFEDFEKIRVIANVKDLYKGVLKNIVQKISADAKGRFTPDASALPLILLGKILQKEIVETEISDKKIDQYLDKISHTISNQQEFAMQIHSFLEFLRKQNEAQENEDKNPQEKKQEAQKKSQDGDVNLNEETPQSQAAQDLQEEEKSSSNPPPQEKMEMPLINEGGMEGMQLKDNSMSSASEEKIEFKNLYHVFTNKFDEVIIPQKLVGKNDLEILRYGLELRISKLKSISRKLALKLKKKLMAKKQYHIEQSDSSGILDRKRFVQMIIDPTFENYFIDEKQHEYHDTIVTILLDNSGSMRGAPIVMSAMACEMIASILEKFSIKTEILGFTTSDWKGGKSRKLWEAQNRPENPGRLSDLRHIIYKSAGQNLKKSKVNLGLMLKEGLLKENIDGEALLWARSRLMQRSEKRKILMIISDGTPVDDSTNSANCSEILVDHLHHVIHLIEKHSKIEIVGIGIGHHVDNFYRNSISIKSVDDLGDVMIEKIADLV